MITLDSEASKFKEIIIVFYTFDIIYAFNYIQFNKKGTINDLIYKMLKIVIN